MSTDSAAVVVDDVAKRFRLIHEHNASVKAAVLSGFRRTVFEEFWALDGVSFEIPQGSTFALIGENGSGKSTLLKCLARIYRPDRGQITTRGSMCALLELGSGFHPELSGRENVYLNGSILGLSKRDVDERFDDIVAFAGLERFIDSPVKTYSSGMFVRLGFAVAINVEPEILLVDEILAVGDEAFQQRCLEKFADFRRSGRTVVVVSHGLETVRNIADYAVWLEHGVMQAQGPATQVVSAYLDRVRSERRAAQPATDHSAASASPDHEAKITSYRLLDRDDRAVDIVGPRDAVTIEVDVTMPTSEAGVLTVDLFRNDGMHISGVRRPIEPDHGTSQRLRYSIDDLRVLPGLYQLNFTLYDSHLEQVLDRADHALRFDVSGSTIRRGMVPFGGEWDEGSGPES